MGSQLGSQALAAVSISIELMPTVYRMAAHGSGVCYGVDCFLDSFLALAGYGNGDKLVGTEAGFQEPAPAIGHG